MELPELPECPVCLQTYDGEYTIPRVLACGHTTCESCLKSLPQKYPDAIRCPSCTQLVKLPQQGGPSSLPKNIDLLRLINPNPQKPQNDVQVLKQPKVDDFLPPLWSGDEFYFKWKKWVLPSDGILIQEKDKGEGFLLEVDCGKRKVRLFNVGSDNLLNGDVSDGGCVFKLSYVARVLNFLHGMRDGKREELGFVLDVCAKRCRTCTVYGLWGCLGDGVLYLVCESLNGSGLDKLGCFENGLSKDGLLWSFATMGMEVCEAVIGLHLEGLVLGCFGVSSFELDGFGHLSLSLCKVLEKGRAVWEHVVEFVSGSNGKRTVGREMGMLVREFLKCEAFVSPEVLFEMLKKEGIKMECGSFTYSVGSGSDVWSLGCALLRLLVGKQFIEELADYVDHALSKTNEENALDCSGLYMGLLEKVSSLLESKFGEKFKSLRQILCQCLNFDPRSRPLVIDVWKCIRELIIGLQFDDMIRLDGAIHNKNKGHVLVLGDLCQVAMEKTEVHKKDDLQRAENSGGENLDEVEAARVNQDFVEGLVEGKVKFKDMQGHLNCVSGLAIGGGYLFGSSYDKSVHVWSLQDFSHVHTFKGHEHKVMAVTYVDDGLPLCISGDSEGGIFFWSISIPLGQEPLKKCYEVKDWRYSGIHALTTAGNGYLYTGSGDRTIKVWSLQEGTLSCTMKGHKSVVSTLTACNGVLCSGSWDGTVRLWSLSDHSLLTVLGEDKPGNMNPVLSLVAKQNMFLAAHKNGHIKVWRNDVFMKSIKPHNDAIFAVGIEGKWLFSGGWDKTVNVQELSEDEFQVDARPIGSIPGGSVVMVLLCWQGKLFVGYGDRSLKVYYYGN